MRRAAVALVLLAVACGPAGESAPTETTGEDRPPPEAGAPAHKSAGRIERRAAAVAAMADAWDGTIRFTASFNALDPTASVAATSDAPAFDPADEFWGLPEGTGREVVAAYCGSCHSLRLVMQQRASAERWSELIAWMSDTQGMPDLEPEERGRAVGYLATHFGAD